MSHGHGTRDPSKREYIRKRKFAKQGGLCCWCGEPMTLEKSRVPVNNYATFEHLIRPLDGGEKRLSSDNVSLSCNKCNRERERQRQLEERR